MSLIKATGFAALAFTPLLVVGATGYRASKVVPPEPVREFRGVWIATVANIDWPSKPGLSTAEQKRQLLAILDRAAQLKLNAVVFQVRPQCDALYASRIEPWSEYLTGTMGRAPHPYYDPLAFAITEAHKRGLQLHAWFNPYRALHFSSKSPVPPNHITRTHPELVRKYGRYLWLDPGEPAVQDYSLRVVMDVVKRYDIDGVQFDDYFYPDRADSGYGEDFPDEASWKKYGAHSGLSRGDWRRQNVNRFIERVYHSIKAAKPWVEFGISPFGIWRPGFPPQIRGADAYTRLYADSRKWLVSGWVDYLAPQLYWPIEQREQSFSALLGWWARQNVKNRHLWPGLAAYKAEDWKAGEISNQIRLTRGLRRAGGYLLYNASALMQNRALDRTLRELNTETALVPASPWLEASFPGRPVVSVETLKSGEVRVRWHPALPSRVALWLIQTRAAGRWKTEIVPGANRGWYSRNARPEIIAVTEVDRYGQASKAMVFEKRPASRGVLSSPHAAGRPHHRGTRRE